MITYNHGRWGVGFIFKLSGSVFPKALVWALPSGTFAAAVNYFVRWWGVNSLDGASMLTAYASFITVLGFMVVFRSNQAWARFWEGASLMQQVRGEWFNATSSIFAFCSRKPGRRDEVQKFQADVVRLMSLMYGSALESLSGSKCVLDVLDQSGLPAGAQAFFQSCNNAAPDHEVRCEIVHQWLQRYIVINADSGVLDVPAPILSRVFQELSHGLVALSSARVINDLPFPFHYAQMLAVMLLAYTFGVSVAAGYVMKSMWGSFGVTAVNVSVLWSVNYLAAEIEQPFGFECNDLPIKHEMDSMNAMLRILLHEETQVPPVYHGMQDATAKIKSLRGSDVLPCGTLVGEWSLLPDGVTVEVPRTRSPASSPTARRSQFFSQYAQDTDAQKYSSSEESKPAKAGVYLFHSEMSGHADGPTLIEPVADAKEQVPEKTAVCTDASFGHRSDRGVSIPVRL